MTTLTVNTDTDFSAQVLASIDTIDFTNRRFVTATATFDASQFDNAQISTSVAIDGSIGFNRIVVNGGSISAGQWSFSNWGSGDKVIFNGTSEADSIGGSIQNDVINGGDGDDILDGQPGIDILNGDAGDDLIFSRDGHGPDTIDGGTDSDALSMQRNSSAVSFTIDISSSGGGGLDIGDGTRISNIERLIVITGSGNDTVTGGVLSDDITGGLGKDKVNGGAGDDLLGGSGGNDTLEGAGGGDLLRGGDGDDTLLGGGGNDVIIGGTGRDLSTGGSGSDSFVFESLDHSGPGAVRDTIADFVHGKDEIDLTSIDAVAGGANDAFTFIAGQQFHNVAGELRFAQTASKTIISGDVNGDGAADFQIGLDGVIALTADDFIL